MAMSLQRLQGLDGSAARGCRGMSSPWISAACSTTVTVSSGGAGRTELCDWTLPEEDWTEGIRGKWDLGWDFMKKGPSGHNIAEAIAVSSLCLSYSVPLRATILLNIYFMLNGSTDVQKAISVESEGTYFQP